MTKIEIPEDGWVEIARVDGKEADGQVEEIPEEVYEDGEQVGVQQGWNNGGETITADVLMVDGKPTRLSVSNSQYVGGGFAEEAFAKYFPSFTLQDNWDCPDGDTVVCTVYEEA